MSRLQGGWAPIGVAGGWRLSSGPTGHVRQSLPKPTPESILLGGCESSRDDPATTPDRANSSFRNIPVRANERLRVTRETKSPSTRKGPEERFPEEIGFACRRHMAQLEYLVEGGQR